MTVRKLIVVILFFFFFQAEDGIRDLTVTGVQTCALPIYPCSTPSRSASNDARPLTFGSVTVVRSTSMMRAGRARYAAAVMSPVTSVFEVNTRIGERSKP